MTPSIEAFQQIVRDLDRLRATEVDVFGADAHGFQPHSKMSEDELRAFEHRHQVQLPEDYRTFLLTVGRGGAGPAYGLFDLGEIDDGFSFRQWVENDLFVGSLRMPFPYNEHWNDLTGQPDEALIETNEDEYERQLNLFEQRYFAPLPGAVPICHLGCALRQWLIVSGPEAGHVWGDDRADQKGLYPLVRHGVDRVTFFRWYRDWLDGVLVNIRTA